MVKQGFVLSAMNFSSHLSTHQAGATAAGSRVIFDTRVLQARFTLLPQGLRGFITH